MDNLICETNARLQEIIDNLTTIKNEYESKIKTNAEEIDKELATVKEYKDEFFTSKAKIDKMNSDIEGFERDYQSLVDRFKDDELANILIAANKEISLKIDERKRKIINDKNAMNELVEKAEKVKKRLVKLTAEKKALEICMNRILDAHDYYTTSLSDIIDYTEKNHGNLSSNKHEIKNDDIKLDSEDYNIDSMKEAVKEELDTTPLTKEFEDDEQDKTEVLPIVDENTIKQSNDFSEIGTIGNLTFNFDNDDNTKVEETVEEEKPDVKDENDIQIDDSIFNVEFDDEIKDE